jgi:hypothetical protein
VDKLSSWLRRRQLRALGLDGTMEEAG